MFCNLLQYGNYIVIYSRENKNCVFGKYDKYYTSIKVRSYL